jgi:peptidoglycan/LPS O-acetylase OafA/YrhL
MKWPQFIFTSLVIATVVIDVVMINIFGVQGSLSQWVRDMAHTSPYAILVIGVLLGHFFANMDTKPRDLTKKVPPQ